MYVQRTARFPGSTRVMIKNALITSFIFTEFSIKTLQLVAMSIQGASNPLPPFLSSAIKALGAFSSLSLSPASPPPPLLSISFYPTARALTTTTFLLSSSSSSPSSSFYFYPSSGVVLLDLPEVHFDCLGPIGAYAGDACVMIAHTALTIIYVVLSLRYVGTRKCMRCGITPDEEEEVEVEEVEEEEDEEEEDEVEMEENDAALRMQPRGAVVDLQVIEADADAGVEIREAAHSGAAAASAAIVVPEVAAAAPGLEFEEDEARLEIQDVEDDGAKEEEDDDEVVVGQLSRLRALHRFIVVKGTLLTDLLTSVLTLTSYSGSSTVLTSTRTSVPNAY